MSHSCPECGQYCCCDMEDHENDEYDDCDHYLSGECRGDDDFYDPNENEILTESGYS